MERCDGKNEMGEKIYIYFSDFNFYAFPKKLCSLQNFPLKVTFITTKLCLECVFNYMLSY